MELFYDLHIHSCLSPCGDMDMTPANIVGMAKLKELDVIALTDHNTCRNCEAAMKVGEAYGVLVIPGMELTTQEEVHVVCLFPDLPSAIGFDAYVYEKLQKIKNKPEIFGRQVLMNEDDEELSEEEYLLINATDISFDKVNAAVKKFGGLMIPAHIDKTSNGLLPTLGFVPDGSDFVCAEVAKREKLPEILEKFPYFKNCKIISDSDAHYLENINERINSIDVEERSIKAVLSALAGKDF